MHLPIVLSLLAIETLTVAYAQVGLKCYQCNGTVECRDPFTRAEHLLKTCEQSGVNSCRKISSTVDNVQYVTRMCGRAPASDGCVRPPGAILSMVCTCKEDGCNKAYSPIRSHNAAFALVLSLAPLILLHLAGF